MFNGMYILLSDIGLRSEVFIQSDLILYSYSASTLVSDE
jgi:hypothetical protein